MSFEADKWDAGTDVLKTFALELLLKKTDNPLGVLRNVMGGFTETNPRNCFGGKNPVTTGVHTYSTEANGEFTVFTGRLSALELRFANSEHTWKSLEELPALDSAPATPFPVGLLPAVVREVVTQGSEALQTPEDLLALLCMGALSTACQGKALLHLADDWQEEPTNLFLLAALESGERKTPALRLAMKPLMDWQTEQTLSMANDIADYEFWKAVHEKKGEALKRDSAKLEGQTLKDSRYEAKALRDSLNEVKAPIPPQLFVSGDITQEELGAQLNTNKVLTVLDDEGRMLSILAGAYSDGPNIEVLLKTYSGSPHQADRRTRHEYVRRPALTVVLAVQPSRLQKAVSNPDFVGPGLLARFLFVRPVSRVGYRKSKPEAMKQKARDDWKNLLLALLENEPQRDELGEYIPATVKLTPEADKVFTALRDELEPLRRKGQRYSAAVSGILSTWAQKLDGNVARIACLLHAAGNPRGWTTADISADSMKAAVAIGRVLAEHTQSAFDLEGESPTMERGRKLLDVLTEGRVAIFTVNLLAENVRKSSLFRTAEDVKGPLRQLEAMGYVAEVHVPQTETSRPLSGRPVQLYALNPHLLLRSEEMRKYGGGHSVKGVKPLSQEETPARQANQIRDIPFREIGFAERIHSDEAAAALEDEFVPYEVDI